MTYCGDVINHHLGNLFLFQFSCICIVRRKPAPRTNFPTNSGWGSLHNTGEAT